MIVEKLELLAISGKDTEQTVEGVSSPCSSTLLFYGGTENT
jgi:hypothetical protein